MAKSKNKGGKKRTLQSKRAPQSTGGTSSQISQQLSPERKKACAACKILKHKCGGDGCLWSLAFKDGPQMEEELKSVLEYYGGPVNVKSLARANHNSEDRPIAVLHLRTEALYRRNHPLRGISGLVEDLTAEIEKLNIKLKNVGASDSPHKKRKITTEGDVETLKPGHLVMTLDKRQDVMKKLMEISKDFSWTCYVISAFGYISKIKLKKPGCSSSETFVGRYLILSLTGSYSFYPGEDNARGINGTLNISLVKSDGNVFGGVVVGNMIADDPLSLNLFLVKKPRLRGDTDGSFSVADLEDLTPTTDKVTSEPENVTAETSDQPPEHVTAAPPQEPVCQLNCASDDIPENLHVDF